MTLISYGSRLSQLASAQPSALAMVHVAQDGTQSTMTWSDLDLRSNQVARLLADRGVAQGGTVAIALKNSLHHFLVTYGAWKLGATVLPMRWDLPSWERERLLGLATPTLCACTWNDVGGTCISPVEVDGTVDLDESVLPDAIPQSVRAIATSGSTGAPKLIVSTLAGAVDPEAAPTKRDRALGVRDNAVQLVASPLYHTNGFRCHRDLLRGHTIILLERFDPQRTVDLIEQWQVNTTVMVPTMLSRILDIGRAETRDFSSIEAIQYGGAPIARSIVHRWFDLVGPEHFFFSYGGTENLGDVMCDGTDWLCHQGTAGRPLDCDVRILDVEGCDVPVGTVGEIFLRRPGVPAQFRYVGAPMSPEVGDGFRSYGDLGWVDADGYIYVADRRTDLIVTGGANVYPAEVELALLDHPAVVDAAVVGLADPEWGRRVHALVVVRNEPAGVPDVADLLEHCRSRVAPYKVPKSIEVVASLPRNDAGKINRGAIAETIGSVPLD